MQNILKKAIPLLLLFMLIAKPAAAFDTAADDQLLMLVNGTHRISAAYKPQDMENTARQTPSTKGSLLLRAPAADAYCRMVEAYKAENPRRTLFSISGYRDFYYQQRLFTSKLLGRQRAGQSYAAAYSNTLQYTALPGTSEHQTGLAIDLSSNSGLSDNFRNTMQGKWLLANCWDHGFILRYDEDKLHLTAIAYEPWHYRYVGLPHSLIIRDNGWVLEEYIDYLQKNGEIEYPDPEDPSMLWRVYWTKDTAREFNGVQNISTDNAGGYIITTKNSLLDELLTAWAEEAIRGGGIFNHIIA